MQAQRLRRLSTFCPVQSSFEISLRNASSVDGGGAQSTAPPPMISRVLLKSAVQAVIGKKRTGKKRTGNKSNGKKRTGKKRIRKRAHVEKSARGKKRTRNKAQQEKSADTIILTDHTFDYCRICVSYKCKYENVCYLITNFSLSSKRENKSKTTRAK